ncbi:MAG: hypothetical protein IH987_13750 [Planctomycetes bacterium]|nr:hypothetical protein [Planctomycetota bacterium]
MRFTKMLCILAVLAWASFHLLAPPVQAQGSAAPDTSGVKIDGEYGPFLPTDISEHGYKIDRVIDIVHVFMAVLFVGWGAFFVYCLVRFRQKPGHQADPHEVKAKVSKWSEIGVAVFEAVLLIGFSMPLWAEVRAEIPADDDPNALHVKVLGEQFAWNFRYAGPDGIFGRSAAKFVKDGTNPMGLDRSDPHGDDDIVSGEFHIPTGKPIVVQLTSKDVIHSFSVPVLRIKQDTIPGMRIPISFTAKKSGVGTYEVACAQLCGNNHYSMRALMYVQSQNDFDAWLIEAGKPPEEFDEDDLD